MKVLYQAEATVSGGRDGHARSSDGRLEVDLSVPKELGGAGGPGTNPEQLFAAGYAACFQSALYNVAIGRDLDLGDTGLTARVGLGPTAGGDFGLSVELDLTAPGLTAEDAAELMARADEICPYSNATRGNILISLLFNGSPVEVPVT